MTRGASSRRARFGDAVIVPLAHARRDWPRSAFKDNHLRLGTKCVGKEGMAELGIAIDETRVQDAITRIEANAVYLDLVPTRAHPRLPATALSRQSKPHLSARAGILLFRGRSFQQLACITDWNPDAFQGMSHKRDSLIPSEDRIATRLKPCGSRTLLHTPW